MNGHRRIENTEDGINLQEKYTGVYRDIAKFSRRKPLTKYYDV